jgi:precorrin-6A synthase
VRRLLVIGIGAGDPDHVTVQAIKAMNRVDVFFVLDKGAAKDDLVRVRRQILDEHVHRPHRVVQAQDPPRDRTPADYRAAVDDWHERRAELYERMLLDELADGECGAFLVWGDPSLYDSTLRIVERVLARGNVSLEYEVVPGITAVQALTARHRIVLNRVGEPVTITTGRRLAGLPAGQDDVVVMLDGEEAFREVDGDDVDIWWGAYLGTPDEVLWSGRLSEVRDDISRTRAEARARKGWIMDTYLLRRRPRN